MVSGNTPRLAVLTGADNAQPRTGRADTTAGPETTAGRGRDITTRPQASLAPRRRAAP
jgi:hypothetical protein